MTRHWYKRIWRRQRKPLAILEGQLEAARVNLALDILAFGKIAAGTSSETEQWFADQQIIRLRRALERAHGSELVKGEDHGVPTY